MRNQTLDRANAQTVFAFELHQLRQTRHCSIVVQNFAENAGWLQSGQPCEI